MKKINKITSWIESNSKDIISNIDIESIDVYNFLQEQFENSNINENFLFQFVYRSFYRLDNAGLTPEFKTEYFNLLENNRNIETIQFENVLKELYEFKNRKGQNTIQFSFVTKLFNTIDNDIPIYDSEVARLFSFSRPYQKEFEIKTSKYYLQFDEIHKSYKKILELDLISKTLKEFDEKFKNHTLSEMKRLDFIFWSAGKIKKNQDKIDKKRTPNTA